MQILVTGGTGFIGRHLCRELDDRGHDVTALARSPSTADLPSGVTTVQGDVTEYDSIEESFEGRDAVVHLVALSPLFRPRGGNRMHDVVHRGGTENAIEAAETAGVDRFVQLSGVGADPTAPTAYLRAKGRAEELVRASGFEGTIIRPTVVFGDGGEFIPFVRKVAPPYVTPLPGGGRTQFQPIWVGDFVPLLATIAEDSPPSEGNDDIEGLNRVFEFAGPRTYSLAEIARLVHKAAGRSSTVVPIPMALAGLGMTVGSFLPGFPFGPDQYRSLKLDLVVKENNVEAFGVDPVDLTTLEDYLAVEKA